MANWWDSAAVVAAPDAPAAADVAVAAAPSQWWDAHDTIDAPSIPAPRAAPATAEAKKGIGLNEAVRAIAEGVPVAGGLVNKADAATNAALAPLLNRFFKPEDQLAEPTFGERYAHSLRDQEAADQRAEQAAPVGVAALKTAGSAAALAPFMVAAPAAFGLEGTLGQMATRGALTNGALSGADAAARGENPIPAAAIGAGAGAVMGPVAKAIGGRAAAVASRAVPEAASAPAGADLVDAASRINVPIPHYLATDSMPVQRMAAGVKNIPIAGDKVVKSAQAVNEGLGNAARTVEQGFGTGSAEVGGSAAKDALANWITDDSKAIANRVYGSVDRLIDPKVMTDLEHTRGVIADIAARRQNAMIPGDSRATNLVLDAVQRPGGMNYQGIKDLRSFVGEKVDQKLNLEGLSPKETSAIYAGLSKDLQQSIQRAGGQKALVAWQKANKTYSDIAARKTDLARIIGAKGDAAPEAVFSRLTAMAGSKSSADIGRLLTARKAMGPEAWNEVASGVVGRLGRDAQGHFSPDRFLTAYGNLSASGKKALFNSTGRADLAQSLDDIATVSAAIKDKIGKFANHSGTAHGLIGAGMFTAVLHEPVTLLTSLLGGHIVADALSQPATAKSIANFAKAYGRAVGSPGASSAQMADRAARAMAATIGSAAKTVDVQAFLKRLQGAIPVPAGEQAPDRGGGRNDQPNRNSVEPKEQ